MGKNLDKILESGGSVVGYKLLNNDMSAIDADEPRLKPGRWGKSSPKENGFSAFFSLYDVFNNYKSGDRLFEVSAKGTVLGYEKGGKFVASEMALSREIDLKRLSVAYAVDCAKRLIWADYPGKTAAGEPSRRAVEAAEAWLNTPSEENRLRAMAIGLGIQANMGSAYKSGMFDEAEYVLEIAQCAAFSAASEATIGFSKNRSLTMISAASEAAGLASRAGAISISASPFFGYNQFYEIEYKKNALKTLAAKY